MFKVVALTRLTGRCSSDPSFIWELKRRLPYFVKEHAEKTKSCKNQGMPIILVGIFFKAIYT